MSGRGLFPSQAWLADLHRRGTDPAFAAARRALDERLSRGRRDLPEIPTRQAGYYHDYFCPTHAVQLVFDPRQPHRHPCPIDGQVFSGEPFDAAWGWSVNDQLSDTALRAAVRWAMRSGTPAQRRADLALVRHVLTSYAARYRTMPPAPKPYPGTYAGVACFSALDEDVWVIRLAWSAALVGDALAPPDRRTIREGLFEPAREHLDRVRYRQVQNVANWDNAALLTLALVLGDAGAVDDLLDGEFGVRDELARGVSPDGLWWEVSLSYHYYVLAALSWTVRALRASDVPVPDVEARVRGMFRAPLDLAFPDGSLPAVNDCWYHIGLLGEVGHGIPNAAGFHELAWAWFRDREFGRVLGANIARAGRVTLEALLDGADAPAEPLDGRPIEHRPGRRFTDLSVLRSAQLTAILKASAGDGDAHGHPDQLGLQLCSAGGRIAIDPGTPGYGIALNDTWYRQTAAHSSVLLDAASQPPAHARWLGEGEAEVDWPDLDRWSAVVDRTQVIEWPQQAEPVYAGVRMRRALTLAGGALDDEFEVAAGAERTIDWLLHIRGSFEGTTRPAPHALAGPCGYDQLTDIRSVTEQGRLHFALPDGRLTITLEGEPGERLYLASAPGNPAADRHLLLVRRRRAAHTRFRARFTLDG